jgi:hypothetical protein
MRRCAVPIGTILAFLAVAALLLACSDSPQSSDTPTPGGSVLGIALFTGGMRQLESSPLPEGFGRNLEYGTPWSGGVVRVSRPGDVEPAHALVTVRPDARGLFRVVLPPGRYVLAAYPHKKSPQRLGDAAIVTVGAGQQARARVFVKGF